MLPRPALQSTLHRTWFFYPAYDEQLCWAGHVAAAADAEKDGPRESTPWALRPLPGAQQSAGLPS